MHSGFRAGHCHFHMIKLCRRGLSARVLQHGGNPIKKKCPEVGEWGRRRRLIILISTLPFSSKERATPFNNGIEQYHNGVYYPSSPRPQPQCQSRTRAQYCCNYLYMHFVYYHHLPWLLTSLHECGVWFRRWADSTSCSNGFQFSCRCLKLMLAVILMDFHSARGSCSPNGLSGTTYQQN